MESRKKTGSGKRDEPKVTVGVRLAASLVKRLDVLARGRGESRGAYSRQVLTDHILDATDHIMDASS